MLLTEKEAELLAILKRDSRKTVSALARELELSRPTVQSMLERLDAVAIEKYTVKLKSEFTNRFIRAFVFMVRDPKYWSRIKSAMLRIQEVKSIHTLTGQARSDRTSLRCSTTVLSIVPFSLKVVYFIAIEGISAMLKWAV